jgi:hypothetical protein
MPGLTGLTPAQRRTYLQQLVIFYRTTDPNTLVEHVGTIPEAEVIVNVIVMASLYILGDARDSRENALAMFNYVIDNKPLPESFTDKDKSRLLALKTLFERVPAGAHVIEDMHEYRDALRTELGHNGGKRNRTLSRKRGLKKRKLTRRK